MVRATLAKTLEIGGVTVAQAVGQVVKEIEKWNVNNYVYITRALSVTNAQIINMEAIFSKPTQDRPVPIAVVCVFFNYDVKTGELTFQFEEENVQHQVGGQSLAYGKFEKWLDRIIGDKLQVRQLHDLATPFESTRLAPPAMPSKPPSEGEQEEQDDEQMHRHPSEQSIDTMAGALPQAVTGKLDKELPLGTLLANIFDAADEDEELELTHKEVADLLYATPLGLEDWDIKLLLTTAHELDTGKIEYKPFVRAAPEIIEALLKRRAAYEERNQGNTVVTLEAIDLCYGEEIEEISRAAREAFSQEDIGGLQTLPRNKFRSCLTSRSERFSMQEVQMLMQMCKEDDFGQVPYDEFVLLLQQLRIDALHNAVVETDIDQLRIHLILLMRREGLHDDPVLPIWSLRNVLLNADQLCLSRMQIHVILSIVHPSEHGEVDVEYFLRVACSVIPYMFDATTFMEKASTIAKEKADALAKAELEELQGLTSSMSAKRKTDEDQEEDTQANAPDKDNVEKALIHNASQYDEKHRQAGTLHYTKFFDAMHSEAVAQCQLSDAELRGFIAEADIDERGEIVYVDHIKMWVPIIFELRKSRVYDNVLAKDWGFGAANLVDLSDQERRFPLLMPKEPEHNDRRRPSQGRLGRRPSSRSLTRSLSKRSSTKDLVDPRQRRNSGGRRPHSRGEDRPQSRQDKGGRRPASRTGSQRSLARSNSRDSNSSVASGASAKSYASNKSFR